MRRINTPDGNWQPGDPSTGIKGTIVTRDYMQSQQEELAAVPESVGIKLDPNDNQQLLKAIRKIFSDGIAGGIQTGGRINGVNSPNLLFNGSAEFGSTSWFSGNSSGIDTNGLVLKPAPGSYGEGTFWALDRDLDGKVGYFVDYSDFVGLADGITISLQAELFAGGLTGGAFYIDAEFYDDATPPKIIGQSQQLKAIPGAGWTYLTASSAVPRGTRKLRIRKVLDGNPKGTRGQIACRRIKLEAGAASSLYSTEADILRVALLDSPALAGKPTAPTPDATDSSTRIATTAFFQGQLGAYAQKQWVQSYAVSKAGDTMTGDLSIKRSDDSAKGVLLKRPDGTSQFWLHCTKDYFSLGVFKADGNWRESVFTVRESDLFTTFIGGVSVSGLTSVNDLNWGNAGARTAFDGNIWGARWSTDGKGSPNWLGEWVQALVNARADWNTVNGKANAGARVQWDSGVAEWGIMDIGINIGAHTIDIPAPWVMMGMRKEANNTRCYLRGVVLRNQ